MNRLFWWCLTAQKEQLFSFVSSAWFQCLFYTQAPLQAAAHGLPACPYPPSLYTITVIRYHVIFLKLDKNMNLLPSGKCKWNTLGSPPAVMLPHPRVLLSKRCLQHSFFTTSFWSGRHWVLSCQGVLGMFSQYLLWLGCSRDLSSALVLITVSYSFNFLPSF